MTFMLMLINLPIVVWMLYTYFREIPGEILEAARMDGATLWGEICLCADADGGAGHRLDHAAQHHPRLERGLLDDPPHHHQRRAADGLHQLVLEPAGPVLGEAVGGLDAGHRPDPDHGLVLAEQLVRGLTFGAVK